MLKRVNETRNPIVITQNGEARAVFLDTDSYQSMKNTQEENLNDVIEYLAKDFINIALEKYKKIRAAVEKGPIP